MPDEEKPYVDPVWDSTTATLRELLEDIFADRIEMEQYDNPGKTDFFSGDNPLTVHSHIYGDEDQPLHVAARRGNTHCVRLLLEAGADPNGKGDLSLSPLYYAIRRNHPAVARQLLEAGARVDDVNEFGLTDLEACDLDRVYSNPEIFRMIQSFWPDAKPRPVREE